MVEPLVDRLTCPVALRLEVAGAEILIADAFVPDKVRLMPDQPIVEPEAVVFPAVFAPSRFIQLFSAAAPGAATEAVTIPPTLVPHVTLLALEKLSVLKVNEPAELDTAGVTPPPALTEIDIPLEAIVPDAFVPLKAAFACTKSEPRLEAIAVVR